MENHWVSPWAEFPHTATPSSAPFLARFRPLPPPLRVPDGYSPHLASHRVRCDTVVWLTLLHFAPRCEPMTPEGRKWLSYLYRTPVQEDCLFRLPPFSPMLVTLATSQEWTESIAMTQFGAFKSCDIELVVLLSQSKSPGVDRLQRKVLKGISGLTVCFWFLVGARGPPMSGSSRSDLGSAQLLGSLACGIVILQDLIKHRIGFDQLYHMTGYGLSQLFRQVSHRDVLVSGEQITRHVSLFVKLWRANRMPEHYKRSIPQPLEFWSCVTFSRHFLYHWDDTFISARQVSAALLVRQTALLSMLCGCIFGTALNGALGNMWVSGPRCATHAGNSVAVSASRLTHSITPLLHNCATNQIREALTRTFQLRIVTAQRDDLEDLFCLLLRVQAWFSMMLRTHDGIVDSDHFFSFFAPAFIFTISQDGPSAPCQLTFPSLSQTSQSSYSGLIPRAYQRSGLCSLRQFFETLLDIDFADDPPQHFKFLLTDEEREWQEQREMSLRVAAAIAARPGDLYCAVGDVLLRRKGVALPQAMHPRLQLLTRPTATTGLCEAIQHTSTATWNLLSLLSAAFLALVQALWTWSLARTHRTPSTQP